MSGTHLSLCSNCLRLAYTARLVAAGTQTLYLKIRSSSHFLKAVLVWKLLLFNSCLRQCSITTCNNCDFQQIIVWEYYLCPLILLDNARKTMWEAWHVYRTTPTLFWALRSLMLEQFTITRRLLCITVLADQQGTRNLIISWYRILWGFYQSFYYSYTMCKQIFFFLSVCRQSQFLWWHWISFTF